MKTILLSNIEYHYLLNVGGDPLIALFATFRCHKPGVVYETEGKKGALSLLRARTGLSRAIVEKYTPLLIEHGLVDIHYNGNVAIRGRNWSRRNLPFIQYNKLIPIQIGPKFTDTQLYAAFVRVHSNITEQKSRIGRKAEQIKLLKEKLNGTLKTQADYKRSERLLQQGGLKTIKSRYLSNSTISNLGFYKLLKNEEGSTENHKRIGHYFKKRLLKRGLIHQCRNVQRVSRLKSRVGLEELVLSESYGGFFIGKTGIYYETSPRIELGTSPLVGNKKKQV
ncbi:hypothetical protein [Robiginitalea sp. IMCC43444]|uniref:hypothetical protein n=1 Tax=Robiginitalea sp. IMCC43444 TaxID=3459121 RepID=UPI0040430ECC